MYRRPGAARQAQESRRQLFREADTRCCFAACTLRPLAPADAWACKPHTHQMNQPESFDACAQAEATPPVLGFSGSLLRFSGSPLPQCTVLGFSVPPQSSSPGRAVAARCTIARSHGVVDMGVRCVVCLRFVCVVCILCFMFVCCVCVLCVFGPRRSRPLYDREIAPYCRHVCELCGVCFVWCVCSVELGFSYLSVFHSLIVLIYSRFSLFSLCFVAFQCIMVYFIVFRCI